ncbi:hypothetical protein A2U01_0005900, partial [Trifolium medium]|nr:hypothetical protein [Trifolium medium]
MSIHFGSSRLRLPSYATCVMAAQRMNAQIAEALAAMADAMTQDAANRTADYGLTSGPVCLR